MLSPVATFYASVTVTKRLSVDQEDGTHACDTPYSRYVDEFRATLHEVARPYAVPQEIGVLEASKLRMGLIDDAGLNAFDDIFNQTQELRDLWQACLEDNSSWYEDAGRRQDIVFCGACLLHPSRRKQGLGVAALEAILTTICRVDDIIVLKALPALTAPGGQDGLEPSRVDCDDETHNLRWHAERLGFARVKRTDYMWRRSPAVAPFPDSITTVSRPPAAFCLQPGRFHVAISHGDLGLPVSSTTGVSAQALSACDEEHTYATRLTTRRLVAANTPGRHLDAFSDCREVPSRRDVRL